ncbi:hypothetical protein M885DRAFT_627171 [Pelagophyceae sp. CCMP2097]|nr:hypothetical protein M885DRAFT_627171 [Pelagophyceae sp. CCMP2097]
MRRCGLAMLVAAATAFEFPGAVFKRPGLQQQLERTARAAALGGDDKALMSAVKELEKSWSSPKLLDNAKAARQLDGRWRLLATLAATVGDDVEVKARRGAVNASGIVIDVGSGDDAPFQDIDVAAGRIGNEIRFKAPLPFSVTISGAFTRGDNARRAEVAFDDLVVADGGGHKILSVGWLFRIAYALAPALATRGTGKKDTSWLETTYLSDTIRVGRGNKGSVFVLDRPNAP